MHEVDYSDFLKKYIRDVPDFPKPGILFRDITPLLSNKDAMRVAIHELVRPWFGKVDAVAAIESRGFLLGAAASQVLGVGLRLIRKPGKLPPPVIEESYDLEYGTDSLQMRDEALWGLMRVLVVDDVIASGGTASAACNLVRRCGGSLVGVASLIDLPALGGSDLLREDGVLVSSVLTY